MIQPVAPTNQLLNLQRTSKLESQTTRAYDQHLELRFTQSQALTFQSHPERLRRVFPSRARDSWLSALKASSACRTEPLQMHDISMSNEEAAKHPAMEMRYTKKEARKIVRETMQSATLLHSQTRTADTARNPTACSKQFANYNGPEMTSDGMK